MIRFNAALIISAITLFGIAASAAAQSVLSENAFLKEDKELYPSIPVKATGADYIWTDDSDAQIKSTDKMFMGKELQSGRIKRDGGDYVVNCTWSSSPGVGKATAVFDLKDIYAVNRVDVWSMSTFKDQLGTVKIEVSRNGIDFREAGTYNAEIPDGVPADKVVYTPSDTICEFPETAVRYVRITTEKAALTAVQKPCYKYILGEIVILGDEYGGALARQIRYEDMYGDEAKYLSDTDYIAVSCDIQNSESSLVTAYYNRDNKLKAIYSSDHDNAASYVLSNKVNSKSIEQGGYLKSFVIESFSSMIPLGDTKTFVPADEIVESTSLCAERVFGGCEWIGESSADINKLFDGNKTETVSSSNDVKVHFSEPIQIGKIAVTEKRSSDAYLSGYDLYVSTDGINYMLSRQISISAPVSGRIRTSSVEMSSAVYASDIKLVFKRKTAAAELSEIEIIGKTPQFKKEKKTLYTYNIKMPFKTGSDITEADADCTLLTTGEKTISSTEDYISVIYDLEEVSWVEKIKINGGFAGGEVSYSIDGNEYYTSDFFSENQSEIRGKANARYIKIVFSKGNADKITLREIKVFTRAINDSSGEQNRIPEQVMLKTYVKANNVVSLDWSEYNEVKNNITGYLIYVESSDFSDASSKTPKKVYVSNSPAAVDSVKTQYCKYSALEPDKDYWIAVVPISPTGRNNSVKPAKIHTFSAIGGETLSGLFNIGEYPGGGSGYEIHTVENCGFSENENYANKLNLINCMGTFQRTKYWTPSESNYNSYIANGLGVNTRLNSADTAAAAIETANKFGTYCFASVNEPDMSKSEYFFNENASESVKSEKSRAYVDYLKSVSDILKNKSQNSVLCAPSTCGTEKLYWYEAIYQKALEMGLRLNDLYDVADIHAYCRKTINDDENKIGQTELDCVPEHLIAKVEKLRGLLQKYGDGDKDIIFTELGWSTHTDKTSHDKETVTKEQQAYFTARAYLISSFLGVKNIYQYSFQDNGPGDDNAEKQFGMVDWYGTPKPAYYSYYVLSRILKNAENAERITSLVHPCYGAVYYDNEKDMYVTALWTADGNARNVSVSTDSKKALMIDMYGNSEYVSPYSLTIGSEPIYLYTSDKPDTVTVR